MKRTIPGRMGTGLFTFLAVLAASSSGSAVTAVRSDLTSATATSHLMVFGGRSASQQGSAGGIKLDPALADLSRHISRVRPGHELEDLHSLSPAAHFMQAAGDPVPLVAIDAITRGDPQALRSALVALGLTHPAVYSNDVGGWLPVTQINAAAARAEVHSIRAAMARTSAVQVTSQGDFAQGTTTLRATYPGLSGAGITVGILSDSFNCYGVYDQPNSGVPATGTQGYAPFGFAKDDAAFDEANGYLPASVNVLEEAQPSCTQYGQPYQLPYADEGRAMMQIVHDVAPGAALAFYTAANTEADFANGIGALATAGATVIADDVGYFDEPFFQDGIVAQAIDAVAAQGVVYVTAAGNNGNNSYENTAPSFATAGSGPTAGENLLNFDTSGATTTTSLPVTIPPLAPGEFLGLIVEWDQPYVTGAPESGGATSSINLCVTGASGYLVTSLDSDSTDLTCAGANATGADAVQVLILGNPANAAGNTPSTKIEVQIGLTVGFPAPGRIKLVVADDGAGSTIDSFATNSPTVQGHRTATGAAAVAAAFFAQTPRCGTSPALLESYSSEGGDPILFSVTGERLTTPELRQKPDFTGPDGVNTSFFGFPLSDSGMTDTSSVSECLNNSTYLNFFGTSAATPHAAGAAALMRQANPALSAAQIFQYLSTSAAPMGGSTPNYDSGYGFIQVDSALALVPAAAPVVQLAASTLTLGASTTLSWLAVNSTACTASGSWSGSQAASGSQSVGPAATGTYTYTLACNSAAGPHSSSATLTVQAAPKGGGGGGALGGATLLALAGFLLARLRRTARSRHAIAAPPA
jgi:subtilisin family serine protease